MATTLPLKESYCIGCGRSHPIEKFYKSPNPIHYNKVIPYCRDCCLRMVHDRIKEFGINLHTSADWQKDPLMTISITTWTDPPPYVPPAGWKGPEYYDIYMKITTTT